MKARLKKIARGIQAAVTSPEAVKQERSLATLVVVRALLAAGASVGLVDLARVLIGG
jgi:hypothetical protein